MRTPLVVISPKSLLRNPDAISNLNELVDGNFSCVIDDNLKNKKECQKTYYVFWKSFL